MWGVRLRRRVGALRALRHLPHADHGSGLIATIQKFLPSSLTTTPRCSRPVPEIDETQEINYSAVMKAIVDTGFKRVLHRSSCRAADAPASQTVRDDLRRVSSVNPALSCGTHALTAGRVAHGQSFAACQTERFGAPGRTRKRSRRAKRSPPSRADRPPLRWAGGWLANPSSRTLVSVSEGWRAQLDSNQRPPA